MNDVDINSKFGELVKDFTIIDEDSQESCEGYQIVDQVDNSSCSNKPKVRTIRSCCGYIAVYCISCYNAICLYHADVQTRGRESHHNGHNLYGNPFSSVDFL